MAKNMFWKLLSLVILLGFAFFCSSSIGSAVGQWSGNVVGIAIGSVNGVTDGLQSGAEDGKADGLSAEDTTVEIESSLATVGNLEVLVAGFTMTNLSEIGDNYKLLYTIEGDAVFSVDLTQVSVSFDVSGDLYISIPIPEVEIYMNQSSTKKLAEISGFDWFTNAESGLTAYLNTMTQTVENAKENIDNYDTLETEARNAAVSQVQQLAKAICGNQKTVYVQFKEE